MKLPSWQYLMISLFISLSFSEHDTEGPSDPSFRESLEENYVMSVLTLS